MAEDKIAGAERTAIAEVRARAADAATRAAATSSRSVTVPMPTRRWSTDNCRLGKLKLTEMRPVSRRAFRFATDRGIVGLAVIRAAYLSKEAVPMKSVVIAAAVAFIAAPLAAQTAPARAAARLPPSLHPQRPQPQPARPKFDLDTPIETIAANAAGKTVLDHRPAEHHRATRVRIVQGHVAQPGRHRCRRVR